MVFIFGIQLWYCSCYISYRNAIPDLYYLVDFAKQTHLMAKFSGKILFSDIFLWFHFTTFISNIQKYIFYIKHFMRLFFFPIGCVLTWYTTASHYSDLHYHPDSEATLLSQLYCFKEVLTRDLRKGLHPTEPPWFTAARSAPPSHRVSGTFYSEGILIFISPQLFLHTFHVIHLHFL